MKVIYEDTYGVPYIKRLIIFFENVKMLKDLCVCVCVSERVCVCVCVCVCV